VRTTGVAVAVLPLVDETGEAVGAIDGVTGDVNHWVLVGLADVTAGVARLRLGRVPDSGDDKGRRPLWGNGLMLEGGVVLVVDSKRIDFSREIS